MRYISTNTATDFPWPGWRERLARAALFFIPRASPDHDRIYPHVRTWLIELDEAGQPRREIGLDGNGLLVLAAPDENNVGFWTDGPYRFAEDEGDAIDPVRFEDFWKQATREPK